MKYDVFISYSRKDYFDNNKMPLPNNIIDKLLAVFNKAGLRAWIDKRGICHGDVFAKKITKAITDSSVFLFVSSKNSNESGCWCEDEIALAKNKRKPIIPLLLDDTPYNDEFALILVKLDYADYASEGDAVLESLVASIRKIIDTDSSQMQEINTAESECELELQVYSYHDDSIVSYELTYDSNRIVIRDGDFTSIKIVRGYKGVLSLLCKTADNVRTRRNYLIGIPNDGKYSNAKEWIPKITKVQQWHIDWEDIKSEQMYNMFSSQNFNVSDQSMIYADFINHFKNQINR